MGQVNVNFEGDYPLENVSMEFLLTMAFNLEPDTDMGWTDRALAAKLLFVDEIIQRLKVAGLLDKDYKFHMAPVYAVA